MSSPNTPLSRRQLLTGLVVSLLPVVLVVAVSFLVSHRALSSPVISAQVPTTTTSTTPTTESVSQDDVAPPLLVKIPTHAVPADAEPVGAGWYRIPATSTELEELTRTGAVVEEVGWVRGFVVPADAWGLEHFLDHDVDAAAAWSKTKGRGAVVAVIDTGVDTSHPALASAVWRNPGEICGNGVDDDGNGFVDDCFGWNFADGTPAVFAGPAEDTHGTHIAGVIAANGAGNLAGLAPEARVMVVKFMKGNAGRTDHAAAAINYAVDNGATVLNLSWGSPEPSQAVSEAIDRAVRRGVVVVVAAGNHRADLADQPMFPAAHPNPGVVTVAAHTPTGALAFFSAYGRGVDVSAPGVGIVSSLPAGRSGSLSGTSMAAPFVAATAALYQSAYPSASPVKVRDVLVTSSAPRAQLVGRVTAGGVLKAGAALGVRSSPPSSPDGGPVSNEAPSLHLSLVSGVGSRSIRVEVEDPDSESVVIKGQGSGGLVFPSVEVSPPAVFEWSLPPGVDRWVWVEAADGDGNTSREVLHLGGSNIDLPPPTPQRLEVVSVVADLTGDGSQEQVVFSVDGDGFVVEVNGAVFLSGDRASFDPVTVRALCVDPGRAVFAVTPVDARSSQVLRFTLDGDGLRAPRRVRTVATPPLLVSGCEVSAGEVVVSTWDWRSELGGLLD